MAANKHKPAFRTHSKIVDMSMADAESKVVSAGIIGTNMRRYKPFESEPIFTCENPNLATAVARGLYQYYNKNKPTSRFSFLVHYGGKSTTVKIESPSPISNGEYLWVCGFALGFSACLPDVF